MEAVEKSVDILQLNMTGMRVVFLFSLLLETPRTVEEINEAYDKNPLIKDKVSYDTIRNDINALRDAGCEISRTTKNNNKYSLLKHPFYFHFDLKSVKTLKKIYNKIYTSVSFEELLCLDDFFRTLAVFSYDENIKEALLKISKITNIDKQLLCELLKYSKSKRQITILYKSQMGKLKEHNVRAEKVEFRHDKLYFFGIDLHYNKNVFYHVKNITKILDVNINGVNRPFEKFKATYKLLNTELENYILSDNEKLVKVEGNDLIIEAETDNDFIMMQNILNFGRQCIVLEPEEFKSQIVDYVKSIRKVYADE